jgi:glycosyltransferase involved in cell wall biosynthesis
VFTRPDKPRATHALTMREQGVRIVAEVDDNYLSDRNLSLAMRHLHDRGDRRRHLEAMGCFDRIIVTTRWLRDYYAKALRKELRVRPEFFVCGNHVDPADWPQRIERDGPLRVGWMGSPSHVWDIKLAYPALKWAADQGHEVVIIGMDPDWRPQSWIRDQGAMRRGEAFGFQYRHVPWVDPRQFNRQLAAYPLDVALAPLLRNEHTLGKSDVKWLEYSMSGAATVASNGTVYSDIEHGETGMLAGGREEMLLWTKELCRNTPLRETLVANAQQHIRETRLIEHHAHEWREAIT